MATTMNLHGVERVTVERAHRLDRSGTWVRDIIVQTDEGSVTLTLFADAPHQLVFSNDA